MEKYSDLSGNSGVSEFEIGDDYIKVKFKKTPKKIYLYTYNSSGKDNIEEMKKLAKEKGRGLNTYINKNIKNSYEKIIDEE
ncbi:hypothetical protein [Candidatus Endomicrobiellum agilis]|jgi:hypothetical protein|uniref:hypothetical protein n=1 Tax=Candidatus Endomicrobiellum agilis TaxID=3238957 RepID=UPI00357F2EC1|nr:hypothetical protein [Endomicrobium sp.]MCA6084732.1 hypothetical protein [Endomicrobium sp.]